MTTATQAADTSTVRDRLLSAAEQVVAKDGVIGLTLDAVAKHAGVSKGGLLYHFPSKSALITAVVERLARQCDSDQDKVLACQCEAAPGTFTRAYIAARADNAPTPEEMPLHTALLAAAGTDPQYLEPFRRRHVEWQKRLENDGIDPATATLVRLAVDGLCLGAMLGMPVPDGQLRRAVIEKLMRMAAPERTTRDAD